MKRLLLQNPPEKLGEKSGGNRSGGSFGGRRRVGRREGGFGQRRGLGQRRGFGQTRKVGSTLGQDYGLDRVRQGTEAGQQKQKQQQQQERREGGFGQKRGLGQTRRVGRALGQVVPGAGRRGAVSLGQDFKDVGLGRARQGTEAGQQKQK